MLLIIKPLLRYPSSVWDYITQQSSTSHRHHMFMVDDSILLGHPFHDENERRLDKIHVFKFWLRSELKWLGNQNWTWALSDDWYTFDFLDPELYDRVKSIETLRKGIPFIMTEWSPSHLIPGVEQLSKRFSNLPEQADEVKELFRSLIKVKQISNDLDLRRLIHLKIFKAIQNGCSKAIEDDQRLTFEVMYFLDHGFEKLYEPEERQLLFLLNDPNYKTWRSQWTYPEPWQSRWGEKYNHKTIKSLWEFFLRLFHVIHRFWYGLGKLKGWIMTMVSQWPLFSSMNHKTENTTVRSNLKLQSLLILKSNSKKKRKKIKNHKGQEPPLR